MILAVVIIQIITAIGHSSCSKETPSGEFMDSYDEAIVIINTTFPADVVLYGGDILFRSNFQYRKADDITNDLLNYDKRKYRRQVIIINELDSAIDFTEEHCKVIKDGLYKNSIDFYYFGSNQIHIQMLIDYAIIGSFPPDEDLSICVALTERNQVRWNGVWTEHDAQIAAIHNRTENLGYALVRHIARCIESNN